LRWRGEFLSLPSRRLCYFAVEGEEKTEEEEEEDEEEDWMNFFYCGIGQVWEFC